MARLAAGIIEKNGGKVDYANMSEFDCPTMNQDLEIDSFHPAGAEEFRKQTPVLQNTCVELFIVDWRFADR